METIEQPILISHPATIPDNLFWALEKLMPKHRPEIYAALDDDQAIQITITIKKDAYGHFPATLTISTPPH